MRMLSCAAIAAAVVGLAACGDGVSGVDGGNGSRVNTGGGAAQGTTPTDGGGETAATGDGAGRPE